MTAISFSYKFGKITERVDSGKERIDRLENRIDNLFTGISTTGRAPSKIESYLEKFDKILEDLKHGKNPLSEEEISRLRTYRNKTAHGIALTIDEYRDFQFLVKKITEELPEEEKKEFDLILAGLIGFIAGLIIASLLGRK